MYKAAIRRRTGEDGLRLLSLAGKRRHSKACMWQGRQMSSLRKHPQKRGPGGCCRSRRPGSNTQSSSQSRGAGVTRVYSQWKKIGQSGGSHRDYAELSLRHAPRVTLGATTTRPPLSRCVRERTVPHVPLALSPHNVIIFPHCQVSI